MEARQAQAEKLRQAAKSENKIEKKISQVSINPESELSEKNESVQMGQVLFPPSDPPVPKEQSKGKPDQAGGKITNNKSRLATNSGKVEEKSDPKLKSDTVPKLSESEFRSKSYQTNLKNKTERQKTSHIMQTDFRDKTVKPSFNVKSTESLESSTTNRDIMESNLIPKTDQDFHFTNNNLATARVPEDEKNYLLLFVTDPSNPIRMNPALFPSEDNIDRSAFSIVPPPFTKKKKKEDLTEGEEEPVREVPKIPDGCTETMLRVDYTPEEYVDQTMGFNYYAQGIRLVDGVRRVVFYHKIINPTEIKPELV